MSTNGLFDNIAFVEKDESRHGFNATFLGDILLVVGVDFVEAQSVLKLVVLRELLENWRDHPAGPTPRSPKVDNNWLIPVDKFSEL